jgi:hypothetical protein
MRLLLAVLSLAVLGSSVGVAPAAAQVPAPSQSPATPRWSLHYTASSRALSVIRTYFVTVRSDGALDWQQVDVETGIVAHGPPQRCGGSAQLNGEELRAMQAAAAALGEARRPAAPPPYVANTVAVGLVVQRDAGSTETSPLVFAPGAPDSDPRLNRAATIWSRYRCS